MGKMQKIITLPEDRITYSEQQIAKYEKLYEQAEGELQSKIAKLLEKKKKGLVGEKSIVYELRHFDEPWYIISDVHIELNDLKAQIDVILLTRKHIYVIESKNWNADVSIDENGCVRSSEYTSGDPGTQNSKHVMLLKQALEFYKENTFKKELLGFNFDELFQSLVVFTNTKYALDVDFGYKNKDNVLRIDKLIDKVEACEKDSKRHPISAKRLETIYKIILALDELALNNYSDSKYDDFASALKEQKLRKRCPICGADMKLREREIDGHPFLGCSRYPKCNGTRNLE